MNYLAPSSSYPSFSNNNGNGDTDKVALSELPSSMQSQQPLGAQLERFLLQQQHRSSSSMSLSSNTSGHSGKCTTSTFPMKLHSMLTDSERLGFDDVVCWLSNQSFKVIDPHRFSIEILPVYFNQTKYKSFQRQLNSYNFQKVQFGPLKGGYTHPYCVKGCPELCKSIKRDCGNGDVCRSSAATVSATASSAPSIQPTALQCVISSEGRESSRVYINESDPIPVMTWDVEAEGAFGDMSSSFRSEDEDTFATTVDEIVAFASSNLVSVDGGSSPFDPTPLPYFLDPVHKANNTSRGLRRGYSATSSAILDQNDIAFFKALFQPGTVSQEMEIMDTFSLGNKEPSQAATSPVELRHQPQPTLLTTNQHPKATTHRMNYSPPQQQRVVPTAATTSTPRVAPQESVVVPTAFTAAVSAYNFPRKLFRLLQDCDTNPEYHPICSWLPDGKQFKIYNKKRFVEIILPNYFDQTHYSSFRRQLNMYSFVRQSMSTYANPHFMRGRRDMLNLVVRKSGNSTNSKND